MSRPTSRAGTAKLRPPSSRMSSRPDSPDRAPFKIEDFDQIPMAAFVVPASSKPPELVFPPEQPRPKSKRYDRPHVGTPYKDPRQKKTVPVLMELPPDETVGSGSVATSTQGGPTNGGSVGWADGKGGQLSVGSVFSKTGTCPSRVTDDEPFGCPSELRKGFWFKSADDVWYPQELFWHDWARLKPVKDSEMDLGDWAVGDYDLAIIGETNTHVNKLILRRNPSLTRHGVEKLRTFERCTHLDLSWNAGIGDEACEHLRRHTKYLRGLNMSGTAVGESSTPLTWTQGSGTTDSEPALVLLRHRVVSPSGPGPFCSSASAIV